MRLTIYNIFELVTGLFLFWTAIYLISSNPFSRKSWVNFGMLMGIGIFVGLDPILIKIVMSDHERFILRILLEWPVFLVPVFIYDLSREAQSLWAKYFTMASYLAGTGLYVYNIFTDSFSKHGIIKSPLVFMGNEYLKPGPLFIVVISFCVLLVLLSAHNYYRYYKAGNKIQLGNMLSAAFFTLTLLIVALSYYQRLSQFCYYSNIGLVIYGLLAIYALIFNRTNIPVDLSFGRSFLYKTLGAFSILAIFVIIYFSFLPFNPSNFILLTILSFLLLLSSSFLDWLNTFINDLVHNLSSGLSLVSDEEASDLLKNFNDMEKIDSSPLKRLKISRRSNYGLNQVDALQNILKASIEYLKPDDTTRRTKQNLKYHLLKMIAYDQSEEGQVLWELGFDDYPLRIMSNESSSRPPLYRAQAASDYPYVSRNAYLALKREAIHDVAWRISYMEKAGK